MNITKTDRLQLQKADFDVVIEMLRIKINKALLKHSPGACVSLHEILGMVSEEVDEFKDEVKANSVNTSFDELIDIAVAAVWGAASINSGLKEE